jgi:hypothetical protein
MAIAISLLGMLLTFLLAYGLDRWTLALQQTVVQTYVVAPYLWISSAANLLLAGVLLLLGWYLAVRAPKNLWVSLAFIIIGLLFTFSTAIIYGVTSELPPASLSAYLTPRVLISGAFIAAAGIAAMVRFIRAYLAAE